MDARFTLAWESERRTRAVIAAVLAGVLQVAGLVVQASAFAPSKHRDDVRDLTEVHRHGAKLVIGAGIQALGLLAAAYVLWYLARAIQARRSEGHVVGFRAIVTGGPVFTAIAAVVTQAFTVSVAGDFVSKHVVSEQAANDFVKHSTAANFAGVISLPATFLLTIAVGLTSYYATRVGLLTRFVGVLGYVVAVAELPIGLPAPLLAFFWFGALAVLFAGRSPQGLPPAWASGRAEPWPSRQQLVEQRDKGRPPAGRPAGGRAGGLFGAWGASRQAPEPAEPEPEPVREAATAGARVRGGANGSRPSGSASKKRKRKRKRRR